MKITATVKEACAMTGIGKNKLYALINAGDLDTVVLGRRRFVKVDSLRKLLEVA